MHGGEAIMPEKLRRVSWDHTSSSLPVLAKPAERTTRPTLRALFLVWCQISVLSFGGGSSTLLLIRREFVERRGWLTGEEYARFWGMGQLSPGANLIAMVILMGRFLGGSAGIVLSLAGLLLPSAVIDSCLAACFLLIRTLRPVQAIVLGVVPATAGVMLTVALQFAQPQVMQSYRGGAVRCIECLLIIIGSTVALIFMHVEDFIVILTAAFVSIAIFLPGDNLLRARRARGDERRAA